MKKKELEKLTTKLQELVDSGVTIGSASSLYDETSIIEEGIVADAESKGIRVAENGFGGHQLIVDGDPNYFIGLRRGVNHEKGTFTLAIFTATDDRKDVTPSGIPWSVSKGDQKVFAY